MDMTFDPQLLADDLREVCRIYGRFFDTLSERAWSRPMGGRTGAWMLHETIGRLCALNGAGLDIEALSIMMFHAGLVHTAQVAQPAGAAPLWTQLTPEILHRQIGRAMRASSLLYRQDIGGVLRATIAFRIAGPGGGEWFIALAPDTPTSGEGSVKRPELMIRLRDTAVFCRMLTERFNMPLGLISGAMRLRGDLRLFLRMNRLFSIDAKP